MSEPRECLCRQRDCFACELAGTREWLATLGLHVVTAAERDAGKTLLSRVMDAFRERKIVAMPSVLHEDICRHLGVAREPSPPCGGPGPCRVCNGQEILRRAGREAAK